MKTFLKILSLAFFFTAITSCQDVIDVQVPNGETRIVISGRVTDQQGVHVKVSTTAPYFSQSATPKIDDAKVFLFEDSVLVSTLTRDDESGSYSSAFNGTIGRTYQIEVQIPADNPSFKESTWRSKPELLKPTVQLDSFAVSYLNRTSRPAVFEEGYYALVYFRELPGKGDYYRIQRWKNDSLITQDVSVTDDTGIDGLYFGGKEFPAFSYYGPIKNPGTTTEPGDSIGLEISSISKNYYDYLNLIITQVYQVGSTFDPPPAPIIGNIYNVDNTDEFGWGYFAASAVATGGIRSQP